MDIVTFNTIIQSSVFLGILSLLGIIIKGLLDRQNKKIDDRKEFTNSVIEELDSIRKIYSDTGKQLDAMRDRLDATNIALLNCTNDKAEMAREMRNFRERISELESEASKLKGRTSLLEGTPS